MSETRIQRLWPGSVKRRGRLRWGGKIQGCRSAYTSRWLQGLKSTSTWKYTRKERKPATGPPRASQRESRGKIEGAAKWWPRRVSRRNYYKYSAAQAPKPSISFWHGPILLPGHRISKSVPMWQMWLMWRNNRDCGLCHICHIGHVVWRSFSRTTPPRGGGYLLFK